jgi:glycosyltransferase involved in cell wall biosynthesis
MRVAVVSLSSRRVGGIEEYLSLVIPALGAAGVEVAFWHELDEPIDRAAIEVPVTVPRFCAADLGSRDAIEALHAWAPDVIYSHGLLHAEVEAELLQMAPAVTFLHTYRGTCISGGKTWTRPDVVPCDRRFGPACLAHYFPHGCGGRSPITMWRQYRRQLDQLNLLRRYDAIITPSGHMQREMTNHGLHAEVIPYPIRTQSTENVRSADGARRLLYAGRMEALKGGLVLIEALPHVVMALGRPVKVTLAGDGRERARWEARLGEVQNSLPNLTFEFTGWVDQDHLCTLMKNTDLLVVPSLWPEPFGLVGPEAAQHGVPSAAFAVGGIPDWLVDGVSGHLAAADPPTASGLAAAIVRCLIDPLHHAALRKGARASSARFTMDRHLSPLIATLGRVKAGNGRS